jgi:hypothetical protein
MNGATFGIMPEINFNQYVNYIDCIYINKNKYFIVACGQGKIGIY